MWATMLWGTPDMLSSTWWLTREESSSELFFGGAEWETREVFFTTSADLALWVRNDPAEVEEVARMAGTEAMALERLLEEFMWDTMLFIILLFRLVMEVAE